MPRFEVAAAYVVGILLPGLEVLRRRTNFDRPESYVDDFIVGVLLLLASQPWLRPPDGGRATGRRRANILRGGAADWRRNVSHCIIEGRRPFRGRKTSPQYTTLPPPCHEELRPT